MSICPTCQQPVQDSARERLLPIEYGADGLPIEGSVHEGYGVPLLSLACGLDVLLDGVPVEHAFGFSRREGWVVRWQADAHGREVHNGRGKIPERLTGEVSLRKQVKRG